MKSRINQLIGQINQEEFEQKEDIKGRRGNQPQQLCFRHRPPSSEILRRGEKKKIGVLGRKSRGQLIRRSY